MKNPRNQVRRNNSAGRTKEQAAKIDRMAAKRQAKSLRQQLEYCADMFGVLKGLFEGEPTSEQLRSFQVDDQTLTMYQCRLFEQFAIANETGFVGCGHKN